MKHDVTCRDVKSLYNLRIRLAYFQGKLDQMADAYIDTSKEAEAISYISVSLSEATYKLDEMFMPE